MKKSKEIVVEKNLQLKFCSACLLNKNITVYRFEMTYSLYDKNTMCIIEHGNLFGMENEIESFSHWHLN